MNKNTEQFQWDESLAREFGDLCNQEGWHHFSGKKNIDTLLEQFKQSKSKTEQPLWEILSFVNTTHNILLKRGGDGYFREKPHHGGSIESLLLSMPHMAIHSVKRLSDGEVFTVGDMVGWGVYKDFQTKLLKFIINDNGVLEFKYMNSANRYSCVDFINAYELYKVKEEAPKEEQVPIKAKEIEDGINTFESFSKGYSMGWKDAHKYNNKKYTEEQLLQARRDAFNAARERIATYDGEQYFPTTKVKYKDNEDYINTLNK